MKLYKFSYCVFKNNCLMRSASHPTLRPFAIYYKYNSSKSLKLA